MIDTVPNRPDQSLQLSSHLSAAQYAEVFHSAGRVQIPKILSELSAKTISDCLSSLDNWNLVFNVDGTHVDTDAADVENWSDDDHRKLRSVIYSQAESDFQYLYEAVPVYDIYHKDLMPGHFLNRIIEFLNGDAFLELMRTVTGDSSIAYADAQATRFRRGHFLTRHDDNVEGKNRRAAFVLSLTHGWSADWGGALQFFDSNGNIQQGYMPTFNTLNLFSVPIPHAVEFVTPFAKGARYSITGWLRSGRDPMRSD